MKKKIAFLLMMGLAVAPAFAGEKQAALDAKKLTGVPNAVALGENLIVGGEPSAEGLRQAAEQGIRTVIDVRTPEEGTAEEQGNAEAMGLNYKNIPLSPANFSEAQADELDKALKDPASGPVLLHCASGQRAVAVWALQRNRHEGVSASQALEEARQKGLKKPELEAKLQSLLV